MSLTLKLFIVCYFLGAILTFDFAVPVDCRGSRDAADFIRCVRINILDSAIDGAFWPIYWGARIALDAR